MMGPVRLPSSAVPPAPTSFRPRKVRPKSFIKRNLPASLTRSIFYPESTVQVLQNEDFANTGGRGYAFRRYRPANPYRNHTLGQPPYCTGGGVMPMKTVPRNLPVGPNFQLNSAKPAWAQAWQPLRSG